MAAKRPSEALAVPTPEKRPKIENTSLSLVKPPEPTKLSDEELCDLKLICSDGELLVQRHFFCDKSEVFRQMLKSGMIEARTNEIKLEGFSKNIIQNIYALLKMNVHEAVNHETISSSIYYNGLAKRSELLIGCVQFAHQYHFKWMLYLLKLIVLLDLPRDEYFKLDIELSLDLRKALLQRWTSLDDDSRRNLVYKDSQIYLDLWDIAIEKSLTGTFVDSFTKSGFNPSIFLVKDVRKFSGYGLVTLFSYLQNPLIFSNILGSYICATDIGKIQVSYREKLQKTSDDWLESARKIAGVFSKPQ